MITSKIKQRIIGKGRGAIFAPTDFLHIESRASVDQALLRLADQGVIRRLTRGLYDYPKKSPRFGLLSGVALQAEQARAGLDASCRAANRCTRLSMDHFANDTPERRDEVFQETAA